MNAILANIPPLELRRKLFHIAFGWVLAGALYFGYITVWHLFALLVGGIIVAWFSTFLRLPVIGWLLERFDRPHDFPGRGALTYVIGVLLAFGLFPRDAALAATVILAVGDGVSGLVGRFGKIKTRLSNTKWFEGTFTGGLLGGFAACAFVTPFEAFAAGFIAMIFEAMELRLNQKILNDNVIVPLVAGTVIVLIRKFGIV